MTDPTTPADRRPDNVRTTAGNRTAPLDDALGALLGIPLRDRIDRHLLEGQRAEATVQRVRQVPRRPESQMDAGAYARGWEACRNAVDQALADPDTAAADADSRPFSDLSRSGLLWLINHSLLHPSGLALTLHTDDFGHAIGWSLVRSPDGGPWTFSDAIDADGERRARATLDTALRSGPDSVRTDQDDRPGVGGIVTGTALVGGTGCELTSADTVRTVSGGTRPDSPDTGSSGFRFEYRARVSRDLAGAAFAEGFAALRQEIDAAQMQPGEDAAPAVLPDTGPSHAG
ncbi:hypothetical protein HEP81_04592 [Streptomyces griseofuscus]|uniref:Uncharacterized protein n=1 Tax=Streptomyces griseofuscus TaxID=146922 RepID=A0A7H1Q3I5_9ACTN|nr:hypothetical protein [Streptomyces griseofuscus]QNT94865.1 hypothetical protein HEP81_04592 [Streptomyces griseofuscus]